MIGIRGIIEEGASLNRVVMMGADFYDSASRRSRAENQGIPIGIGKGTRIENAIVDKNARIGDGCVLSPAGKPAEVDHPLYYIRDGVLIIPKNGVIPHGTMV